MFVPKERGNIVKCYLMKYSALLVQLIEASLGNCVFLKVKLKLCE